jgi:uncharacterized iron-regulated protein
LTAAWSFALAAALACAAGAPSAAPPDPPLWSTRESRFVDERVLVDALRAARFRFIGEVHDHAGQQLVRARLVAELAAAKPAAVMEIFDFGHDAAIAIAQAAGGDAEAIATAGGLDRAAWRWPLHRPVVEAALEAGLPIRAGNVPRAELMRLARSGDAGRWRARIASTPWSDADDAALKADIVESHCGALPGSAVPAIALAQRIRDAAMAEALAGAAREAGGAVLLAGNGHVRRDAGAPRYLARSELPRGAEDVVAVAFVEAADGEMRAPDFPRRIAGMQQAFDYVWFTPAVSRPDPCEAMKGRPVRAP